MKKRSRYETPWTGYWFKERGYQLDVPVLVTPYDEEIKVTDVDCIPYNRQLMNAMERKIKELEKELSDTQQPKNVVAFAPYLRRKEYHQTHRPTA